MVDRITLRSPMADVEDRLGIEPIHEVMARRERLVEEAAELRALHGSFGLFDARRKTELAAIKMSLRARSQRDKMRVTEGALDDAAHADPRYVEFVTQATIDRARLSVLEHKIHALDESVHRANTITRHLSAEARL